jgi:dihydroxyacetone kinase-like protein
VTPLQVGAAEVRAYLGRCVAATERHRAYLTRLDAVLGDGDHGDNMAIGFQAVLDLLDTYPPETSPGELLRAVGHRLATAVGGASGPLYGTALIEAGLMAGSEPVLDWQQIGRMLDAAATGVARRGRCIAGDKTIFDTLRPAADAAMADGGGLGEMLLAAWRGMRSTRPLVARRGLALRLGERSAGHLDPGAVSCFILLGALAR